MGQSGWSGPIEVLDLQMFAGLTNPEKPPPDSPLGPAAPRRGGTAPSFRRGAATQSTIIDSPASL